jgi:hypothetical protein
MNDQPHPDQDTIVTAADARLAELEAFYTHLVAYVIVNAFLFLVDLLTGLEGWFFYPLLGWGIGLLTHAFYVYGLAVFLGGIWVRTGQRIRGERARRER